MFPPEPKASGNLISNTSSHQQSPCELQKELITKIQPLLDLHNLPTLASATSDDIFLQQNKLIFQLLQNKKEALDKDRKRLEEDRKIQEDLLKKKNEEFQRKELMRKQFEKKSFDPTSYND